MKYSSLKLMAAQTIMIILWGSAFAGIRIGLKGFSPEHLSLFRLLVGSIILFIYAAWQRMKLPELKDIPMMLLLGFLGFAVYQTSLNIGERTVNAGAASLIVSLTPIFIGFFSFLFQKKNRENRYGLGAS